MRHGYALFLISLLFVSPAAAVEKPLPPCKPGGMGFDEWSTGLNFFDNHHHLLRSKKMFTQQKSIWILIATVLLLATCCAQQVAKPISLQQPPKPRLIILADMGNEPDEEQQMIHMIMCSNEFKIEGLIAVTGLFLRPDSKNAYKQILHPELFTNIINAYSKTYKNLQKHASGWHTPAYLHSIVKTGQRGYGIADTGKGKSSPGSKLIIHAVTKDDPRPIWVVVNAGSNTLAQALWDYRNTHSKTEVDAFVAKLRVFENGAQDNSGAWICNQFPKIHWIRSNYQTYCYGGPNFEASRSERNRNSLGPNSWKPYEYSALGQHLWALKHIIADHGPIGFLYPLRQFPSGKIHFIEGGGTIPWLGLVNKGLFDMEQPGWGGWSGRFSRRKVKNYWSKHSRVKKDEQANAPFFLYKEMPDQWTDPDTGIKYNNIYTPVWRWRQAFYNDFLCRMDWCVKPYNKANHHPIAALNGDTTDAIVRMNVTIGQTIALDASASSDPDNDKLKILWYTYPEAGTYPNPVSLTKTTGPTTTVTIPQDASGKQIHVILEVQDQSSIATLYDYRRIVLDVE